MIDQHYLVGRRFECVTARPIPDLTFVSYVPDQGVRWHALDGHRGWMTLARAQSLIMAGKLVESETGAPFVLPSASDHVAVRHTERMRRFHR